MAQTSTKIRFVYGTKAKYTASASTYADDVYFATDTREIIARGTVFGLSSEAAADLTALENAFTAAAFDGTTLNLTRKGGSKVSITLLSDTAAKAPGTAAAGASDLAARADHVHPMQTSVSGNAGTATKLQTPRTIDGVNFDGSASVHHFATCSTAAGTAAKAASLTGFTLTTGARVTVKFQNTNTASSPTLNVNSTGAKAIRYNGAAVTASYLKANRTYELVYDGTAWQLVGDIDTNTTYSAATQSASGLMSAADKKKLDGITAGAKPVTVDSALSSTSTNPVQNKAIKAELDKKVPIGSDGKIASSYLPSYVDDVVEFAQSATGQSAGTNFDGLEEMTLYGDPDQNPPQIFFVADSTKHLWGDSSWYATWPDLAPQAGKIYVNTSSNITYRWSGSTLVEISKSLALGDTSSTAFRGDRGKTLEGEMDAVQAQLCWFQA